MREQLIFAMKYPKKNLNKTNQTYMFKKIVLLLAVVASCFASNAQEIEKKWQLSESKKDFVEFEKGKYNISIEKDSLIHEGEYLIQENFIFLYK